MLKKIILCFLVIILAACSGTVDSSLESRLQFFGITALQAPPSHSNEKILLGQKLFFDKVLSGNQNIACSTCHSPTHATTDGLTLSIGTGGTGTGPERDLGTGHFIARNAQDLFNRGFPEVHTMFTDMRVSGTALEGFITPAGNQLPENLENVLAAQALFPITSRDEMRGTEGDNDLANFDDDDFTGIWQAILERVLAIPEYQTLLLEAYPNKSLDELTIADLANAIAAFETDAFTFINSPFDAYLAGNKEALNSSEKNGALLFYGKANCVTCHTGNLFFDQDVDNIDTPLLGPGKGTEAPLDTGIQNVSGLASDRFVFRSAPLRNLELTAPYMHNGAYATLEAVVEHYIDPQKALKNYDPTQIDERLQDQVHNTVNDQADLNRTFSEDLPRLVLTDNEKADLVAFLKSLTDPAARDLSDVVPSSVPSNLSIDE
ncbi:hypothetical protein K1X76_12185 [bacterium]|nr:hypothetical protein [bacterium]